MLPNGNFQPYEDYCRSCSSPITNLRSINVVLGDGPGKAIFPFQFKGLWIYPHLFYKILSSGQWITVSGSYLQPTEDYSSLVYYEKPHYPIRIFELFPAENPSLVSNFPIYFKGLTIERHHQYTIRVNESTLVVYGAQLQPSVDMRTLLLDQGGGRFVPVAEISPYQGDVAYNNQPQALHGFYFQGVFVYPYNHYRIFVNNTWLTVFGSQLRLSNDGPYMVFEQSPGNHINVHNVFPIVTDQRSSSPVVRVRYRSTSPFMSPSNNPRPSSPKFRNNYNSQISQTFQPIDPANNTPNTDKGRSPSPIKIPSKKYADSNVQTFAAKLSVMTNTSPIPPNDKSQIPLQPCSPPAKKPNDGLPVRPYSRERNSVPPTDRVYPYKFKDLNIYADRQYHVKVNNVWEIVDGRQLHPARNDNTSLICNFANFAAAIVNEVFLYQPECYSPVNVTVNGIRISPSERYYVDLGNAGCLLVPGILIQQHSSNNGAVVWHNGTYHNIVSIRIISNSPLSHLGVNIVESPPKPTYPKCTCNNSQPCSIIPFECQRCSQFLLKSNSRPGSVLTSPSRKQTTDINSPGLQSTAVIHQSSDSKKISQSSSSSSESSFCETEDTTQKFFKNVQIYPDLDYSVILENNETRIVKGDEIKTSKDKKYVKVMVKGQLYRAYFLRPVTPENDDEPTSHCLGFYKVFLTGRWRQVSSANVTPSFKRPGRYIVLYEGQKYLVKAVNVIPLLMGEDDLITENDGDHPYLPLHPKCDSPVHPHPPLSESSHSGRLSSRLNTSLVKSAGPNVLPLRELYDTDGRLKPEYNSLLSINEPHVILPSDFMLNKPASASLPIHINGVLISEHQLYEVKIDGNSYVVPGERFQPRPEMPGEFAMAIGACKVAIPSSATIMHLDSRRKSNHYLPGNKSRPGSTKFLNKSDSFSDSDNEIGESERYIALIKGVWTRVGPKAIRPSKTQKGYAVIKYANSVHLVKETEIRVLGKKENVVSLESKLPNGRKVFKTWLVIKLKSAGALLEIKDMANSKQDSPVFVLKNCETRNINDKEIRQVTSCIRAHFDDAQVVFEDDYVQLSNSGFTSSILIWVIIRRNKRPQFYHLINDLSDKPYLDKTISETTYSFSENRCSTAPPSQSRLPTPRLPGSPFRCDAMQNHYTGSRIPAFGSSKSAFRRTYNSSSQFTSNSGKRRSNIFNKLSSATVG